jgi:predicted nuclease of predicted toxin-antitoxin system
MKILLDQGAPRPLRTVLTAHSVSTAHEMGWASLTNGDLLHAAEKQFDVLITTDRNLRYQQNTSGLRLAILVLPTTNWTTIQLHTPEIVAALDKLRAGDLVEVQFI